MNLRQFLNQNRITPHKTSKQEIKNLLNLIDRDIADSKIELISADRRFATVYNAALQLGTILLYCSGYKTKGIGHHFTVFQAMKEILGKHYYELSDYFDSCRSKRNITDYMGTGTVSEAEVKELIKEVENFRKNVIEWLKNNHRDLV